MREGRGRTGEAGGPAGDKFHNLVISETCGALDWTLIMAISSAKMEITYFTAPNPLVFIKTTFFQSLK